jgi:hypothetical protein
LRTRIKVTRIKQNQVVKSRNFEKGSYRPPPVRLR